MSEQLELPNLIDVDEIVEVMRQIARGRKGKLQRVSRDELVQMARNVLNKNGLGY